MIVNILILQLFKNELTEQNIELLCYLLGYLIFNVYLLLPKMLKAT